MAHQISGKTFQITEGSGIYFDKFTLFFDDGEDLYRSESTVREGDYALKGSLNNRFYVRNNFV